jgi:hypothetical protein
MTRQATRRKYKRRKPFRLTQEHWEVIELNLARIQEGDEWSLRNLLQAEIWNGLAPSQRVLNQARRDLGRDFCRAFAAEQVIGIEPVPGSRAPILWRCK